MESILENYEKVALNIYYMNKTTGDETNTTVTMTQAPGGNVGGVDTMKVTFSIKGDEQTNLTMWVSKDYSTVVKIEMNGQVLEGQLANVYGQQFLKQASAILMPYTYVGDIRFKIASDSAVALKTGWEVTSVTPTTTSISGHSYKAYSIAVKNVADSDNAASDVKLVVAEISPNVWVITHINVNMKDGSVFSVQITELVPKA